MFYVKMDYHKGEYRLYSSKFIEMRYAGYDIQIDSDMRGAIHKSKRIAQAAAFRDFANKNPEKINKEVVK